MNVDAGSVRGESRRAGTAGNMSTQSRRLTLYALLLATDLIALFLGAGIASSIVVFTEGHPGNYWLIGALFAAYLVNGATGGAYSFAVLRRTIESIRRALSAFVLALCLVLLVVFALRGTSDAMRLNFIVTSGLDAILLILGRILAGRYTVRLPIKLLVNELLIVDGRRRKVTGNLAYMLDAQEAGLRPDLHDPVQLDRFGQLALEFDRIIVDAVPERRTAWARLLKGANVDGEILLDEYDQLDAIGMRRVDGKLSVMVSRTPLSLSHRIQKRLLDLAVAIPAVIALGPLLAIVAIAIKLDTPGPVFFRQVRVGHGNRLFKIYKFRSMKVAMSDGDGARSAARDDDRITRIGKFIRATSIDELPQLLNVLIGNMSLVGPRPHALGSRAGDRLFWQIDETYWHRHQLKPGLTGLAQVRGYRGATLEPQDLTKRLEADMEYIQDWDLWRDIAILANTFRVIVHRNAF